MGIIDRARFVLFGDIPGHQKGRASAVDNPITRAILMSVGKQAIWSKQNFETLSREGYEKCMAAYACVSLIANAAGGIEFKVIQGKKDIEEHPVLDLLRRPNAYEGKRAWMRKRFSQLLLAGNAYTQAIRPTKSRPPAALYLPMPQRMAVDPGTPPILVGGYIYEVNGRKTNLDAELVLHSKLFHPTDDWYGLSPLSVASRGVDISNMAAEWNMRLLQNDMRPAGILSSETSLGEPTRERMKTELKESYGGYENAGTPLVLEGGLKWQQLGMSSKDLDWLGAVDRNKREIASVYNIAPELIGDSANKTYSNFQEARRALYTETVLPLMDEYVDDLNSWLCPMFEEGLRLVVDRDKIEALQEDREKKFTYINGCRVMKIDEKRRALGLDPIGEKNGGEMILVSAADIPLEFVAVDPDPPAETEPAADPDPDDSEEGQDEGAKAAGKKPRRMLRDAPSRKSWSAPERKDALWKNFALRVETKERGLVATALRYLKDQAQRVAKAKNVDIQTESQAFAKAIRPWAIWSAIRAGASGVRASKGELPDLDEKVNLFELTAEQIRHLDEMILHSGTKIAESTMALVRDILKIAESETWTTEELAQGLKDKLEGFAQWRCRTIARTESAKVENWGQLEGYKSTEFVNKKGWLCSRVPESREDHVQADGQEVGIDEAFIVGGEQMQYPGDPAGDAGNVVNCLCSHYPIVE